MTTLCLSQNVCTQDSPSSPLPLPSFFNSLLPFFTLKRYPKPETLLNPILYPHSSFLLSVCVPVSVCLCLSVSVCVCVCLCVCVNLSIYLPTYLSVYLSHFLLLLLLLLSLSPLPPWPFPSPLSPLPFSLCPPLFHSPLLFLTLAASLLIPKLKSLNHHTTNRCGIPDRFRRYNRLRLLLSLFKLFRHKATRYYTRHGTYLYFLILQLWLTLC